MSLTYGIKDERMDMYVWDNSQTVFIHGRPKGSIAEGILTQ